MFNGMNGLEILKSWPRFEDGEPVRIGAKVDDIVVRSVVFQETGILVTDGTSLPGWNKWRRYKEPFPRPAPKVLDADGAEIRAGDTVWRVKDGDGPYHVTVIRDGVSVCVDESVGEYRPDELTHERPDSWERIEEDKDLNPFDYCKKVGHKLWTFDNAEEFKASDLVRRCKALAERGE